MKERQMIFSKRLTPVLMIFLVAVMLTIPLATGHTYSDRSESLDHTLTYTKNSLMWDKATKVDAKTGVAELDVFDAMYDNVKSQDGRNVIAPGTEGYNIVRLKNDAAGTIEYTAVLYTIKSDDKLPVKVFLTGEGMTDTTTYALPKGVDKSDVIKAVSGKLSGGKVQDFDIHWLWNFETSDAQDVIDTNFGVTAQSNPDELTVGLYIVVEDNTNYGGSGDYIKPTAPKTGDSGVRTYVLLAGGAVCAGLLELIPYEKRRKQNAD